MSVHTNLTTSKPSCYNGYTEFLFVIYQVAYRANLSVVYSVM